MLYTPTLPFLLDFQTNRPAVLSNYLLFYLEMDALFPLFIRRTLAIISENQRKSEINFQTSRLTAWEICCNIVKKLTIWVSEASKLYYMFCSLIELLLLKARKIYPELKITAAPLEKDSLISLKTVESINFLSDRYYTFGVIFQTFPTPSDHIKTIKAHVSYVRTQFLVLYIWKDTMPFHSRFECTSKIFRKYP